MNVGDRIPEVLGIDQEGREIKSSDYRGRRTIGILRTTYLVNEDGIIEKIFTPKEIKTKIHAEQILEYVRK